MTDSTGHVELRGVRKSFGSFDAISDLDLAIPKGEFCALLGPSGCGKSTLLRLIAGLEGVSEGRIFINGQDVTNVHPSKRAIAMVFQSYALYPHMSVRENIGFSLEVAGLPKAERRKRAEEVGALLQLGPMLDRRPAQLSGGQRQRVAIGRALVRDPQVFLFDEPLSNLDAKLRVQMRLELSNLHQQLATTMIYVTHDQVEAMTMADRIVVLDHGRIMQVGAPLELYGRPANRFVASFIGAPAMNFLPVTAALPEGESITLTVPGFAPIAIGPQRRPSRPVVEIGVRPEHVFLTDPGSPDTIGRGKIALLERLGNSTIAYLTTEAGQISVQGGGDLAARIGDNAGFAIDTERLHLFDADGNAIQD